MNSVNLEKAIDWYFREGYKHLAKNPSGTFQAVCSSSMGRIHKLMDLMNSEGSEIIILLYEKNANKLRKFKAENNG